MFDKLEKFTKKVSDLPDKPSQGYTAADIKEAFDAAPEELRVTLNQLITDLLSGAAAALIGARTLNDSDDTTIQALFNTIKTNIDENYSNLLSQIQGIALGAIPDKSITPEKLSFNPISLIDVAAIRKDSSKPLVVEVRTSDPSNPVVGQIWYRSDL